MATDTDSSDEFRSADGDDVFTSLRQQVDSLHRVDDPEVALAHLAAIVESSDDAIISKSLDGVILSWNDAAERIFGYSAEEAMGQSIQMLVPPDRLGEEADILARVQRGERLSHFETVRLTRDGRPLEVRVSISPIKDADGRIVAASKVLRDLTSSHASQQILRDSEARLRGVVDSAVDGILTINETGIIESVNPAGIRTFGYPAEELIGQNVKLIMPEPYFSEHDSYLANYRQSAQRKIIGIGREVVGRRKDGTTFPVELAVSEVHLGSGRLFTGIVRDITSRKESEQAVLSEKEKAEEASRAKEHFLSVLSHELRTPLTPALAELSFMQERTDLSEEIRAHLGMIRRNIETEARLVDDLLDLTRIARDKISLHYEVVDLHHIIDDVIRMFDAPIRAKSLGISRSLNARRHHVWADPGRLQQIFLNLLSNAVRFTGERGWIAINTSDGRGGDAIHLEVKDNGAGIESDMIERIFEPFEQSVQSRRGGGLGLGLAISRSLTALHKGTLTASSDGAGRGSSFMLTLATAAPAEPGESVSVAPVPGKLKQHILLVEDHADTLAVMARLLRSLGCQVTTAGSVREAIEAAEKSTFDLLISDIGLPDGSGLEVMQHFKKLQIRGIALSGFGLEEDHRRSREAGFDLHLTKPLNFNTLREILSQPAYSN